MSASKKIAQWVHKKPIILIRFTEKFSETLHNSRNGFEHLTIVKPHAIFQDFKLPTLCLMEIQEQGETRCYLATATRKIAVSTFDSRLTIKKLRPITSPSLQELGEKLTNARMRRMFVERTPAEGYFSHLSPKLSLHLVERMAIDPGNQAALDTAFAQLPKIRQASNTSWAQEDAIQISMNVFGVRNNSTPNEVVIKKGTSSGLSLIGAYILEDNVVLADASQLPGFSAIAPDITGRAIFQKGNERLIIYTANKRPLENMFGVDLIYINETQGNVVMVQYKMLEESKKSEDDWCFRPDNQLQKEINRMNLPSISISAKDYRLNRNPFFFKFVKRKIKDNSDQSFLISLDHLNHIFTTPEAKGPRGGIRISYNALNGTYLRETDMIGLIRSGYIGTHRAETKALTTIIDAVARGNKALVLAWQRRLES